MDSTWKTIRCLLLPLFVAPLMHQLFHSRQLKLIKNTLNNLTDRINIREVWQKGFFSSINGVYIFVVDRETMSNEPINLRGYLMTIFQIRL